MIFLNLIQWGEVNNLDPLFENVQLPDGIDKNILKDKIVYDNWDLEPRITDYYLFKKMIENFFALKLETYTKIYNALEKTAYNPLYNYDRYEEKNECKNTDTNDTNKRNNTEDLTTNTTETTKENESNTTEHKTSAYNSTQYQPSSIDTETSKSSTDSKNTDTQQRKENGTDTRDIKTLDSYITNNHLYGNIGVTTSQQMLESEIELREKYNIYDLISIDFRKEFMLLLL